jgi:Zn-dependent peptidase ImmA (M78 family)
MINNYVSQKNAADFRLKNGISDFEPFRLRNWLLKLDVMTVFRPMSDKFCGMALKDNNSRFILVNSNHTLGKQHFTVAHELYHLFVQEEFTSMVCATGLFNKKDKEEYEADCFASHLLLPENGVLALIPKEELKKNKITLATILRIEQHFECSRRALLIRLESLGLIDVSKYQDYMTNVRKSALSYGYDTLLYDKGNENLVIGKYGEMAKKLFDKEKISESHYISLMKDIWIDLDKENNE